MNESYWQRGFDDGLAQRPASPPNRNGQWDHQNEGYSNGYEAGRSKRRAADWPARRERMLRLLTTENDCEDQGFALISEGCNECAFWEGDTRIRPPIKDRGDGFLCCVKCGASYGQAKPPVAPQPES
jgi:hypothetical protein